MARKFLLLLLLICGGLCMGQAQEDGKIVLKGVVQDARTNEPIPFVNIGLLGTVAGVASDVDDSNWSSRIGMQPMSCVSRLSVMLQRISKYMKYKINPTSKSCCSRKLMGSGR